MAGRRLVSTTSQPPIDCENCGSSASPKKSGRTSTEAAPHPRSRRARAVSLTVSRRVNATNTERGGASSSEFFAAALAERAALPVHPLHAVRRCHHALVVVAVGEAEEMPGLVDRGLGHALGGEAVVAGEAVELLPQAGVRDDRGAGAEGGR